MIFLGGEMIMNTFYINIDQNTRIRIIDWLVTVDDRNCSHRLFKFKI